MHELSIVDALIEQAQKEVQRAGQTGRIVRLDVVVGRLSGVSCDSLRFAFELLSVETPLEGAKLHIDEPRAVLRCTACGSQTAIDGITVRCPHCDSMEVLIEGGRELLLESIELED